MRKRTTEHWHKPNAQTCVSCGNPMQSCWSCWLRWFCFLKLEGTWRISRLMKLYSWHCVAVLNALMSYSVL
jgi:hypothetical protein